MPDKTVLILDDEEAVRIYLTRVLDRLGCRVVEANNSTDGLRILKETPGISAVVTDVHMPGQPQGVELWKALRAARPDCPLVIISGFPTDELFKMAQDVGVADFLTKPFELPQIQMVMKKLLG